MSATCEKCKGFGETLRGTGIYDCQAPSCTAAVDRTALEESLPAAAVFHPFDTLWVGYMEGRSVALEEAKKEAIAADLDARNDVTSACGLGENRLRSFTWNFLLNYIRAAVDEAEQ